MSSMSVLQNTMLPAPIIAILRNAVTSGICRRTLLNALHKAFVFEEVETFFSGGHDV